MNEHLSEALLEKYVLEGKQLNGLQTQAIGQHLQHCALCREHTGMLEKMYAQISNGLQEAPSQQDIECAERLFFPKRRSFFSKMLPEGREEETVFPRSLPVLQPVWAPAVQRIVRYAQIHPLRFASVNFAAVSLLALLFIISRPAPPQPAYARAQNEHLVVYDKDGNVLWKKYVGLNYNTEYLLSQHVGHGPDEYIEVADVDNDGQMEVLTVFGLVETKLEHNAVYCFNADGSQKWKYNFNRQMIFGVEEFTDNYKAQLLSVRDFDHDGKMDVIAVIHENIFYPAAVVKLDAASGAFISEYWHSGNLTRIYNHDLDGDGIEEIILCGENNGYDQAALIVLDSRHISGRSLAPPSYMPQNVAAGQEKYYLLIPPINLASTMDKKRNSIRKIHFLNEDLMMADVLETYLGKTFSNMFFFNRQLQCAEVKFNDMFVVLHRQLKAQGMVLPALDAAYAEILRHSVRYWDGEKFVEEAVKNRKYFRKNNVLP